MAKQFNPFDPLGLFDRGRAPGSSPSGLESIDSKLGAISKPFGRKFPPPPPDPLNLFGKGEQGFSLPDPLGILRRSSRRGNPAPPGATIGNPIPIEWAGEIVPLKNQARQTLINRGYPDRQVDMALHWAEEWLIGMARRMAPGNTELQKTVVVSAYADIANRAEKWLQGIEAAFSVTPNMLAQMARS